MAIKDRIRAQADAFAFLQSVFDQEATHFRRLCQAESLDALRARVEQDAADLQLAETIASSRAAEERLKGGLGNFAFSTIMAVLLRTKEHPISVGARLASLEFARTQPLRTVMVAIGPGGIPNDVQVTHLPQKVVGEPNEQSATTASFEVEGYLLLTPESFLSLIDGLKDKVLQGLLVLPAFKEDILP